MHVKRCDKCDTSTVQGHRCPESKRIFAKIPKSNLGSPDYNRAYNAYLTHLHGN